MSATPAVAVRIAYRAPPRALRVIPCMVTVSRVVRRCRGRCRWFYATRWVGRGLCPWTVLVGRLPASATPAAVPPQSGWWPVAGARHAAGGHGVGGRRVRVWRWGARRCLGGGVFLAGGGGAPGAPPPLR